MATIMVVDDAAFMRTMLKMILSELGHQVIEEAANGEEAVHFYKAHRPDLVMMDIVMPVKDGLLALKEIRAFDPNAVVIMCTAVGQQRNVVDAIQSGARDFLVKPFSKERILDSLRRLTTA
ncbi:response regulator [Paenibacillus cremeus]|uniref:Response regulator n=1 Tax=Paenibacillus cremeus TaxID=2163881 RepID=A0A559KC55_9BACL|nr:response regulator [Paenibacillus cremeus]TVY09714.1 response regulator [Paenibacillus cremeus]